MRPPVRRRLLLAISFGALVTAALLLHAAPALVLAIGYVALVATSAASVSGEPLHRARQLVNWRDERLGELVTITRDTLVEEATHGGLSTRISAVLATASRLSETALRGMHDARTDG